MVHSSYSVSTGFRGSPVEIIKALRESIGAEGNLLMPSLPYRSSTKKYLQETNVFDGTHTVSRMGIISEVFRRQRGVYRSLSPTHPILASGPMASWFVEGHEYCLYPCGPDSPFEKMAKTGAKVVLFDTPFTASFTFFHYLEHLVKDSLPFSLYDGELFSVTVIGCDGMQKMVDACVFSEEAVKRRRLSILEKWLVQKGLLKKINIGNTRLRLVHIQDAVNVTLEMAERGVYFYNLR